MSGLLPVLLAGLGGGALALALREVVWASPQLARSVESWLSALLLAGRLGRDPTTAERRGLGLAAAACLAVAALLVFGLRPPALLAVLGPAAAERLLGRRRRRYREAVAAGVPTLARALADALAAGGSLRRALIDAAPTLDGPCGAELRRVRVDLELGRSPAAALRAFAGRIGSQPVAALVAAAISQQRTGGDLATLLRRQADAEVGRRKAEAAARSATSQARLSGMIVAGMPIAVALLVELVSPGFAAGIAADPIAVVLTLIAAALQLVGYLAIQRLGRPPL